MRDDESYSSSQKYLNAPSEKIYGVVKKEEKLMLGNTEMYFSNGMVSNKSFKIPYVFGFDKILLLMTKPNLNMITQDDLSYRTFIKDQ